MKPEKFIGIMLITLLLSCEMEDQPACSKDTVDQKVGEVSFETNLHIMNSSFGMDIFIDGKKINKPDQLNSTVLYKTLEVGIHQYEVKIYTFNGEPSKTIKGRFMIEQNKTSEVFIDFKKFNSWT